MRGPLGLATQIRTNGVVTGICDGFGIHAFESSYESAPTLYSRSEPGLGSVLKAAVLMAASFWARPLPPSHHTNLKKIKYTSPSITMVGCGEPIAKRMHYS